MALVSGTIWEIRADATTGTVNGGGFNTANANFPTDATTDSNTGNTAAPVLSSATYNFVAGDVNAWVYIKAGTSWTPGFYKIASVASNKATLSAAVGAAIQLDATSGEWIANTVAGVATVGTPTGGTFGVDYSQQAAAKLTATDYGSLGSDATLTSSITGGFTPVSVGNIFHQTTTGTGAFGAVGWYEIVSYTDANNVVLDRSPNGGTASVGCTGYVGGAINLDTLADGFLEAVPASSLIWVRSGTHTASAFSVASTTSTATAPTFIVGYTSLRGDTCNGTSRPLFDGAAGAAATFGQAMCLRNLSFSAITSTGVSLGVSANAKNCKFRNYSGTASRAGITLTTDSVLVGCECISTNGAAISSSAARLKIISCYIHDSVTGFSGSGAASTIIGNIFEACSTAAMTLSSTTGSHAIINNTIYGREAQMGVGINLTGANSPNNVSMNNIIYGQTSGVVVNTGAANTNLGANNDYFNNGANASNYLISRSAVTTTPAFTGATQITGSTATTSGSVLTQSGGDFSTVTNNVDYVRVISGTSVTTGCYLITSHTSTTLTTELPLGTSSAGNVVYFVTTGHNFGVGTNMKAAAFQIDNDGSESSSYLDIGAVQRPETGGGSSTFA